MYIGTKDQGAMSSTRKFISLYLTGGLIILLCLHLVGWTNRQNKRLPNAETVQLLAQAPLPWQSETDLNQIVGRNYMFTLRIPEQMTMSSIHFHQLLNVINDWNFTGVEPFVYSDRSTLYGLRSSHAHDPKGSIPYNRLYNSTLQNKYFSECMKREPDPKTGVPSPLFVPMVEYLRSSYRKLVLVHFASHAAPQVIPSQTCSRVDAEVNQQREPFIDCSAAAKKHGMYVRVEQLLSKEEEIERLYPSMEGSPPLPRQLPQFKVVQAFCIKKGVKISLRDLKSFIFSHVGAHQAEDGINKFSIVFTSWQGRFTHPLVDSDVKNYINICRIPWGTPFYSDYVKNAAKTYIDSLNFHGQPYLSIHVRFEKLYETVGRNRAKAVPYVDCCMKQLDSVITSVMTKFNITKGNAILNWDYSPYGSTVCPIYQCKELANENLKKLSVKPTFVDPKKLNLPPNRGLIALIEMNILYSGKVLLTAGHGSYQYTIIQSFISAHQERYMSEAGVTDTKAALKKAQELHYGDICKPGNKNIHELTVEPVC